MIQQGYDNSESSVRKACVFCLVAIYAVIGEDLKPHLSQLSSSKVSWPQSVSDLYSSQATVFKSIFLVTTQEQFLVFCENL